MSQHIINHKLICPVLITDESTRIVICATGVVLGIIAYILIFRLFNQ